MAQNTYMEMLKQNYCQTTTQYTINSNTGTVENLLNPDRRVQYYSDTMNNDATTVSMRISFDATTTVSRISLIGHNFKKFNIYYNGATANAFAMTSTSATTTSQFLTNSETSQYFRVTPVDCTSVTIDIYSTQVANSEKAISQVVLSDPLVVFSRMPNANSYSPKIEVEQVVHQMSDGGYRTHTVQAKYAIDLKMKFLTTAFRNQLLSVYNLQAPFMFCPFGTTTAWDAILFEAIWPGNFDLFKYADDALASGFSGTISMRETTP